MGGQPPALAGSEVNEAEYRKLRDRYEIVVTLPEFAEPEAPAE